MLDVFIGPASPLLSLQLSVWVVLGLSFVYVKRLLSFIDIATAAFLGCLLTIIAASAINLCFGDSELVTLGDVALDVNTQNIKWSVHLAIACIMYGVFKSLLLSKTTKIHLNFVSVVLVACGLYVALAIVFALNVEIFWIIKNWFFRVDIDMSSNEELARAGYLSRYPFIFLDPNNSAYFVLMLSIFVIEDPWSPSWARKTAWLTALASPILSASSGGLLALLVYMGVKVTVSAWDVLVCRRESWMPRLSHLLYVVFGAALAAVAWLRIEDIEQLGVVSRLLLKADSPDPRAEKYFYLLSAGWPPILGRGHTMVVDGELFRPHSDHLRLLYGYGVIVYLSAVIVLCKHFKLSKSSYFIIPVVVASALNSVIDEPRFLYSFIVLLAVTNTRPISVSPRASDLS